MQLSYGEVFQGSRESHQSSGSKLQHHFKASISEMPGTHKAHLSHQPHSFNNMSVPALQQGLFNPWMVGTYLEKGSVSVAAAAATIGEKPSNSINKSSVPALPSGLFNPGRAGNYLGPTLKPWNRLSPLKDLINPGGRRGLSVPALPSGLFNPGRAGNYLGPTLQPWNRLLPLKDLINPGERRARGGVALCHCCRHWSHLSSNRLLPSRTSLILARVRGLSLPRLLDPSTTSHSARTDSRHKGSHQSWREKGSVTAAATTTGISLILARGGVCSVAIAAPTTGKSRISFIESGVPALQPAFELTLAIKDLINPGERTGVLSLLPPPTLLTAHQKWCSALQSGLFNPWRAWSYLGPTIIAFEPILAIKDLINPGERRGLLLLSLLPPPPKPTVEPTLASIGSH
ncbi:hypothetical protein BDR26DRAFT_934339 [Obelidium mucronatum]|nr:hypothetical protein BDR26DRAFT_934339 [Obelidium mucronatum]